MIVEENNYDKTHLNRRWPLTKAKTEDIIS